MSSTVDFTLSGVTAIVASIFSSKLMIAATDAVAEVTNTAAPTWVNALMGPFGALIGLALGLSWMNKRLNKAEEKNDKREAERDEDRKALITVVQQNSHILEDVKDLLNNQRKP